MRWEVQIKKAFSNPETTELSDYEIVVINEKGNYKSWGFGDQNKIILFGGGIGQNHTRDLDLAAKMAEIFKDALNASEYGGQT